jgi:hypothetical protein
MVDKLAQEETSYHSRLKKNDSSLERIYPKKMEGRPFSVSHDIRKALRAESRKQEREKKKNRNNRIKETRLDRMYDKIIERREPVFITPLDINDKANIDTDLSDEEFTFLKDNWHTPKI